VPAPLTRYRGPDDFRYRRLAARLRVFRREFLLFRAVRHGSDETLVLDNVLAKERLDLDLPRFLGNTALHIATKEGFYEKVKTLLSRAADMKLQNEQGQTALQIAVENLDENMVKILLKKGARRDAKSNGISPKDWLRKNKRKFEELDQSEKWKKVFGLLKNPPLVQGPSTNPDSDFRKISPGATYPDEPPPPPLPPYGRKACAKFEFTIGNFFHATDPNDGNNREEYFTIRTASVHDVLYRPGFLKSFRNDVSDKATEIGKEFNKPHLRWYHVPANNAST
jgi:hypothetical protein